MMEVLMYSLRKFPSPIATVEGKLVKTPKAKLLHILEDRVQDPLTEEFLENNALILDGMALIQTIKHVPETFGDLVESILVRILSSAANSKSTRVDFVCDTYPDISIKNLERSERTDTGSTVIMILSRQQVFVSWENKDALIEFFLHHLKNVEILLTSLVSVELFLLTESCVIESVHPLKAKLCLRNARNCVVIMKKRIQDCYFMHDTHPQPTIV